MARLGLTSEAVLVNQRGDIAGEQLTRLDPRGGGQLVTHAAGPLVLSEAAPVSLLFFIFRGSHIVSSAHRREETHDRVAAQIRRRGGVVHREPRHRVRRAHSRQGGIP